MKYVIAFIAGTLAGAAIALLFAPESGEELRTHISERAAAEQERAMAEYHRRMEEMQERISKVQSDMQAMVQRAKEDNEAAPEGYVVSE